MPNDSCYIFLSKVYSSYVGQIAFKLMLQWWKHVFASIYHMVLEQRQRIDTAMDPIDKRNFRTRSYVYYLGL